MRASSIILLIIIIYVLLYHWANNIEVLEFYGNNPGPTILFIGSVHGNEPAGGLALDILTSRLIKNKPDNGKIVIIRRPNKLGFLLNMRCLPHRLLNRDLNRNFPRLNNQYPADPISEKICKIVNQCDFILDMHEGWGWANHSQSLGSGIYPGITPQSIKLGNYICDSLNANINDPKKKWIMEENSHPELTSLRSYCCLIKKEYILIETTGQNDIQPKSVRINQNLHIIDIIIKKYHLFNIYG